MRACSPLEKHTYSDIDAAWECLTEKYGVAPLEQAWAIDATPPCIDDWHHMGLDGDWKDVADLADALGALAEVPSC